MASEPKRLELTPLQEIQFMYPHEPVWEEVDTETLVGLVEEFEFEPSCATIAIGVLKSRKDVRTEELARWLLSHQEADQWLKAAAGDVLNPD